MNHNNFNRIQLYLNHKMTGQEKEQFELDLFTDVELRKDYDQEVEQLQVARYLVDETLSEREEQLFEASWREATQQVAKELENEKKPQKPDHSRTWVLTGIAALLVIALSLFYLNYQTPPDKDLDTTYSRIPLPIADNQSFKIDKLQDYYGRVHELNGGTSTKEVMQNLLNSLKEEDYSQAILHSDTFFLITHDSTARNALFLRAYSLLQLDQPSEAQIREALYIFEEKLFDVPVSQMISPWEVTYFKALCYARLNNQMAAGALLRQLLQIDCDDMGVFSENCTLYKKEALNLYNSFNQ
ncbi:MAG: hypothetical protein AAGG75_02020 [Bacteroidota bacterium]